MAKDEKKSNLTQTRATIRDVARIAKVDPSLVSRIVNNDPKASASPATRQRVLNAVQELGYRANSAARMLKTARTQMIGLLLPDMANPMYSSIITGVEHRCKELGYGILIGDHAEGNSEKTFTDLLERGQVDGLLIASGTLSDTFLKQEILDQYKSVVMVNRRVKGVSASVTVNDELGASIAVDHLAQFGAQTIAGIFGPSNIDTAQRRRKGFESAALRNKLKQIVIEESSWGMEAGRRAGLELLTKKKSPDVVFASTIMMGIGFIKAAHELGVTIPDKIRVAALHDSDIANYLTPSLTTIHLPTAEMGSQSVDLLLRIISGGMPSHLIVDTAPVLIARESTSMPER